MRPEDLRIDIYTFGTQAVRITHLPTGLVAESNETKSYLKNRDLALKQLEAKLNDIAVKL